MGILEWIILICIICGILGLLESARECRNFIITHYNIETAKLQNSKENKLDKKIIMLSDLHNKEYGQGNVKLLDAIRTEQPDIIIIAGDMLVGKSTVPFEKAVYFMEKLSEIAPIYYGNGNHEQRMKESVDKFGRKYVDYKDALQEHGIIFLENESKNIKLGDKEICISGLEIPLRFFERRSSYDFERKEISDQLGKASPLYQIIIAHHPLYAEEYIDWGADLVLSGHLHGGVVRLPYIGAFITPQFKFFPKYSGGNYKYKESDIIVSRGIGEHTIKVRFANKPEVIVLHF